MRATQRIAMQRFLEEGFDQVTVESIAADSEMAASTVFRHFGTKERLVLWDEHEIELEGALLRRLRQQPPLMALRDAFTESLAARYESELDFQLRRIQFIYATVELHAAAVESDYRARTQLARAIEANLSRHNRRKASLVAGAALLALDIAFDRWQKSAAEESLANCIKDAFDDLTHLEKIA